MVRKEQKHEADTGIFWGAVGIGVSTVLLTFGIAAYHTYTQYEGSDAPLSAAKTPVAQQVE